MFIQQCRKIISERKEKKIKDESKPVRCQGKNGMQYTAQCEIYKCFDPTNRLQMYDVQIALNYTIKTA